ncbi:hypothetical protein DVS28_b0436 (plasmid) [Euzebya pacifica]|uniref:Uncharacterized protein n=1 Tax=Euzebya pacifica TaxID=1608957 RepID=A0A346Y6S9_9ACTN|nr:hypothetical protein [Euzebya pacifica]AXV10176.1 hypothetical protein DVS28_b0436 [Euzebya pacifica]
MALDAVSLHPASPDLIGRIWVAADTGPDRNLLDDLAWGRARHQFVNRWASGLLDLGGERLRAAGIRPAVHIWGRPWLIVNDDVAGGLDAYRSAADPNQVDDVVADQLASVGIDPQQVVPAQTAIGSPAHHRERVASTLAAIGETVAAIRSGTEELDGPDGPIGTGPALTAAIADVLRLASVIEPGWMTGPIGLSRRLGSLGVDPDRVMAPADLLMADGLPAAGFAWVAPDRVAELAAGLAHLSDRFASLAVDSAVVNEAAAQAQRRGFGLVEAHGIHTRSATGG